MEGAFSWITQLVEAILKVVPRLIVQRATHIGAKFVNGWKVVELRAGLHVYWPLVSSYCEYPCVRQTTNLPTQSLCTKDGRSISISGIVIWEATGVGILSRVWCPEQVCMDFALAAIKSVVIEHTLEQMLANQGGIDDLLTDKLKDELVPFDIAVIRVALTDLAPSTVIHIWGEKGYSGGSHE